MARYRTKQCEIEALEWNGEFDREMSLFVFGNATIKGTERPYEMIIHTLEGYMKASVGDFIIKGLRGELYPCKPDVFHKKYELVK